MRKIGQLYLIGVAALTACAVPVDGVVRGWETSQERATAAAAGGCEPSLDRALVLPVRQAARPQAFSMLRHRAIVPLSDEQALALGRRPPPPDATSRRPFLVRAVAKVEATGGFYASLCGSDLRVLHGSLAHRSVMPPTVRVPLIVYLQRAPRRVLSYWQLAE